MAWLAGFFGGFLALIVILLLPDQSQYQQELIHEAKAHQQEVDALKARIAQLESLQSPPRAGGVCRSAGGWTMRRFPGEGG